MTQTQKLHRLLFVGSNHSDFQISSSQLNHQFDEVDKEAIKLGWLNKSYSDSYLCDCGAYHPVRLFEKRYFTGCDIDEYSGLEELQKSELLIYIFSLLKFTQWLNSKLDLQEEVEKLSDEVWYLGQLQASGQTRKVFFTSSNKRVGAVPKSKGRIVLAVGKNEHEQFDEAINLLSLLSASKQGFSLDTKKLLSIFSTHQPVIGLTVRINEILKLTQSDDRKKNLLHFGKLTKGKFEHVVSVKPQAFNIVNYLYKLPATNSKRSSAELEKQQGLAQHRRNITARIKDVNDILLDKNFPKLVLTDADNKHYINPDLLA